MTLIQAAVLGIVQGITEFLPISSDGHLAVAFMAFGQPFNLDYVVFLHFATLLAIFAYFWRDVVALLAALLPRNAHRQADRRLVWLIVLGTGLAAAIALGLEPLLEEAASNRVFVAAGFLLTSALLASGEFLSVRAQAAEAAREAGVENGGDPEIATAASRLPWRNAAIIGVLQGLAALPGVSRSGSTTAAGLMSGLKREDAARYSFLLGIPIISLAAAKDGLDMISGTGSLPKTPELVVGFLTAGVAGYIAIWGLLKLVKSHTLYWFAAYTALAGILLLIVPISSL